MTDEITSRLATIGDLGVISRSSAMQYQNTTKSTKQIGQELRVDYLLAGTVRWSRSGNSNRVRITPQLIRVTDDTQVWSNIYDHVIDDVFRVQSDVAQGVIAQLGITLGESKQKSLAEAPTSNLEAYQFYLRGNDALLNTPGYDQKTFEMAVKHYQKAVELDPSFAAAFASLARAHLHLFHEGYDPSPERLNLAKTAMEKAVQLKPDLPKAYVALGFYYYYGFRDYERALDAFAKAVKASPNEVEALSAIAFVERRQGKFEDSLKHLKTIVELDPRNAGLPSEIGAVLTRLRRYAEANNYYDRSLQLAPDQVYGYGSKRDNILLWKGDLKEARKILEKMPEKEPNFYFAYW
ncbi:MAG: tetratricopeptide repeat protein, partial [Acidobacteriota bacterium]